MSDEIGKYKEIIKYLPDDLKFDSDWHKNLNLLLNSWRVAYQTLVNEKLSEFVDKLNEKIFQEQNRIAYQIPTNKNSIKSCKSIKDKIFRWLSESEENKIPKDINKKDLKNMRSDEFLKLMLNKIDDAMITSAYFLCSESAEKFAKKENLEIELLSSTPKGHCEVKNISEYFYFDNVFNEERLFRHLNWLKNSKKIPNFPIRIRILPPEEEVIGREKIINEIKEKLISKHVSLHAPRAMGKTSIMHVLSEKPFNSFLPFFVQLRNIHSCTAFIGTIAYSLSKDKNEVEREDIRENKEKEAKEDLFNTIEHLFEINKNYLILMDEFADFLRNIKENDDELKCFFLLFENLCKRKNIRFISASSDSEARIIGNRSNILDCFEKISIPPLSKINGMILFEELLFNSEIHVTKKDIEDACELLGEQVPYLIHAFVSIWKESKFKNNKNNITPQEVYDKEFLEITGNNLLREFHDFPKRYPGDKPKAAYNLLAELTKQAKPKEYFKSISPINTWSNEDYSDLLERLSDDLLIKEEHGIISFRLKLFKDFWTRYPVR